MVRCTSSRSATSCTVMPPGAAATISKGPDPPVQGLRPGVPRRRAYAATGGSGFHVGHRCSFRSKCVSRPPKLLTTHSGLPGRTAQA